MTTIGPAVSEITCLITMDTDRQVDRQTNRNGRLLFSYCRGHELSKKHKSGNSSDGLDYYTSLVYDREVKSHVTYIRTCIVKN